MQVDQQAVRAQQDAREAEAISSLLSGLLQPPETTQDTDTSSAQLDARSELDARSQLDEAIGSGMLGGAAPSSSDAGPPLTPPRAMKPPVPVPSVIQLRATVGDP